jgi:hypothetical protein
MLLFLVYGIEMYKDVVYYILVSGSEDMCVYFFDVCKETKPCDYFCCSHDNKSWKQIIILLTFSGTVNTHYVEVLSDIIFQLESKSIKVIRANYHLTITMNEYICTMLSETLISHQHHHFNWKLTCSHHETTITHSLISHFLDNSKFEYGSFIVIVRW